MSHTRDTHRDRATAKVAITAAVYAVLVLAVASAGTASPQTPQVTNVACDPDPGFPGAVCGTVDVPLDRAQPTLGTIPIYFELYPHTDTSKPSLGTIVPSIGGPGAANTRSIGRALWLRMFAPLLDRRDLLLIDHRGIGNSGAIDCPALQHGLGPLPAAVRACGAQLGAAADRYGSGDVADDIDAVRAALGIDKIDYYGASYGGVDGAAYAYRHADHLRSVILDSPYVSGIDDAFSRADTRYNASAPAIVCSRSPSCAAANPDPAASFAWLASELRKHPFDGVGYDADGVAHPLHVDEASLFDLIGNPTLKPPPAFLNLGELTAAATALRHGDRVPLLRLLAENPVSLDNGDPAGLFSIGASFAVGCADGRFPWDVNAPEPVRQAQFEAAFAALPPDSFAPFSAAAFRAVNEREFSNNADGCVPWPSPTRPDPPYPPTGTFPDVPTLVITGDLDHLAPELEREFASRFPDGRFLQVRNAGHVAGIWSPCAQRIEFAFIANFQTGDTSCANDPNSPFHAPFLDADTTGVIYPGVGRFAKTADQATPATVDPSGNDNTTPADRRIVTVAWGAVEDALYDSRRLSGATGHDLRGGTYTVSTSNTTTQLDLNSVRFSDDVAVSGQVSLDPATNTVDAEVTVNGLGNHDGTLSIRGVLFTPETPNGHVRGTLHGRQVALLVPMN